MGKCRSKKLVLVMVIVLMIVGAGLVSACAPQSGDSSGSTKETDLVAVSWTADADCSICHAIEETSREDAECIATYHATLKCTDCHANSVDIATVHEGVSSDDKMPTRLLKTKVDKAGCLSCHEGLAEKTANYTGLVDEEGTVVNPHEIPENADHSNIACGDCHAMHEPNTDVLKSSKLECLSCHHENVFECGTCHN